MSLRFHIGDTVHLPNPNIGDIITKITNEIIRFPEGGTVIPTIDKPEATDATATDISTTLTM